MKYLIIPLLILTLFSCEKINLQQADYDIPVVEGYLLPGRDVKIIITRQMVFESEDSTEFSIPDLDVQITEGANQYTLMNNGDSLYTSSELTIEAEKTYNLSFTYHGKMVTSSTTIPAKPVDYQISDTLLQAIDFASIEPGTYFVRPDSDTLTWSNPENDFYMLIVENTELSPVKINSDDDRPARVFRNEPVQTASQEVNPMNFNYYGYHNLILYHLNDEYAALYEQLGTTSLALTAPPSNITNGLGIFTGINTDTVVVNVIAATE